MDLPTITKLNEIKPENLCAVTHGGSHFVTAGNSQAFSIKEMVMEKIKRVPRNYCKCGCGGLAKDGKRFIRGHHLVSPEKREELSKLRSGAGNGMYGKKDSDKTRKLKSKATSGENNPMYGKHHTEEALEKMRGPKHHNWRGGITDDPYCPIFSDQEFKKIIFERDGYKCQNPLCRENCYHLSLVPHHIDYDKMNCDLRNMVTTCRSCNSRANFNRKFWQKHYEDIIPKQQL